MVSVRRLHFPSGRTTCLLGGLLDLLRRAAPAAPTSMGPDRKRQMWRQSGFVVVGAHEAAPSCGPALHPGPALLRRASSGALVCPVHEFGMAAARALWRAPGTSLPGLGRQAVWRRPEVRSALSCALCRGRGRAADTAGRKTMRFCGCRLYTPSAAYSPKERCRGHFEPAPLASHSRDSSQRRRRRWQWRVGHCQLAC